MMRLRRGINIEGWLRACNAPEREKTSGFTREDVELVARLGFDHVRVNVNEEHLWRPDGRRREWSFAAVDRLLDDCADCGLEAIFDLHTLYCHSFDKWQDQSLFEKQECVDHFTARWRELSEWLRPRPETLLAYEFLNEPIARNSADWNRVMMHVYAAVRELEPERTLLWCSNRWSQPEEFAHLEFPEDPNILPTFHFYRSVLLTHYGCPGRNWGFYGGPVQYPGVPIASTCLDGLTEEERRIVEPHNDLHDRAFLDSWIRKAVERCAERGLPLYCGEFGSTTKAPRELRLRWFRDMISILSDHDIGWGAYAYRGWSVVFDEEGKVDDELVGILMQRSQ